MHEVTCYRCGNTVYISPDAVRCSTCGEDLTRLISSDDASGYFCTRATEMATKGDERAALQEVERGVAYASSSELRLLGAILAKNLHKFDEMRRHVAALPLDDPLRDEGEWLLRSHQAQLRNQREVRKVQRGRPESSNDESDELSALFDSDDNHRPLQHSSERSQIGRTALLLAAVTTIMLMSWVILRADGANRFGWLNPFATTSALTPFSQAENEAAPLENNSITVPPAGGPISESDLPVNGNNIPVQDSATVPVAVPTDAVELHENLPGKLIEETEPKNDEVADVNPQNVGTTELYDLASALRIAGYAELAELPVQARIVDEQLVLEGFVTEVQQRQLLLDVVQSASGITDVHALNLLVHLPATYTVQPGDTLWTIVFNLYGDVERLDEFTQYNADILSSPDYLEVGLELKVLPLD